MKEVLTFAGVPAAVMLSFVLALGIEVLLLGSAIRLMHRAVAARDHEAADVKQFDPR